MTDADDSVGRGYALGAEDGEALWHLGGLLTLKAAGEQTEGRFAAHHGATILGPPPGLDE